MIGNYRQKDNSRCRQAYPAQAAGAQLVAAAADGHLQRRIEADVALVAGHARRRWSPAVM